MNIPGFTAETSLYGTTGNYRAMAGAPDSFADGRGVVPAELPDDACNECRLNCFYTWLDSVGYCISLGQRDDRQMCMDFINMNLDSCRNDKCEFECTFG